MLNVVFLYFSIHIISSLDIHEIVCKYYIELSNLPASETYPMQQITVSKFNLKLIRTESNYHLLGTCTAINFSFK